MPRDCITLGPLQFSMCPLELVSIRMAVCPMGMLRGTWDFTLEPKAESSCLALGNSPCTRWSWCARGWRCATWGPTGASGTSPSNLKPNSHV